MNAIRFVITDRSTGQKYTMPAPKVNMGKRGPWIDPTEESNLKAGIKNLSKLGLVMA